MSAEEGLRSFIAGVEGFADLGPTEKVRLFAWLQHHLFKRERFVTGDINWCYDALHFQPGNTSQYLKNMANAGELLGNPTSGYRCEGKFRADYSARYGKGESPITFVNPTKAVQSVVKLHDFFSEFKGSVKICDPYFDIITLQHLEAFSSATAIRLLTSSVTDTATLRTALSAFASQKQIEVRKPVSDVLHDRYIIDSNSMLITGTSLNSFGKKQSFVIKIGQDIRSIVLANFDQLWAAAKPWP